MAVLVSIGSGNLSDSSKFGVVDATSYLNAENATESLLTTAYSGTRSSAFTPGAITISHIGVKLCERIGTTGTISVHMNLSATHVEVPGTEVTINVSDLPSALEADANGGFIFFKLASPVTLLAATGYEIEAKTSSASQVDLWCNGTVDNLARALVTTTTAAPGAGDDIIIAGEKTGAGTGNNFTITMDSTAATDFGAASTSLITPAIAVCSGGTLQYGTSSATNYILRVSGNIIVYSGGTLNIGTTGTPIPRDSTAVLELDCAADGDFGLIIRNLGTCNMQGLSRTSGKNIVSCKLNTDEAINSTSLGVDTDTGWLDNDQIVVASTTRTASQTELGAMNGDAGASTLTVDSFGGAGGGLANAHSGTSPTQAEIINLTRNVKVRSVTSTLMAYVNFKPTATVDIDWTEFYYLGESASNKRGINCETTTGSVNIQFSSLHDFEDFGIYFEGSNLGTINISNNVMYNLNNTQAASSGSIYYPLTSTGSASITIDNNILLFCYAGASGATQAAVIFFGIDFSGTLTNNTIAGGTSSSGRTGFGFASNVFGTVSGNTVHSSNGDGFGLGNIAGRIANLGVVTAWRNAGAGITLIPNNSQCGPTVIVTGGALTANTTNNISCPGFFELIKLSNVDLNADSSFSTTNGIGGFSTDVGGRIQLINCRFSNLTAHTNDINATNPTPTMMISVDAINTTFAASVEFLNQTNLHATCYFRSNKHDQSATTHKALYRFGTINADQTTRHTASGYSWKLTPNNASIKLVLPGPTVADTMKSAVAASSLVTITAYVRKDSSYNGNAPRLVLIGGIVGGIASDVIASLSVGADTWEQLSVSGTPNEAGVLEYYIDCDGTAGNVYVDDISISQA